MVLANLFANPKDLEGNRLAGPGLDIIKWISSDKDHLIYACMLANGEKKLVYLYSSEATRNDKITHIFNYENIFETALSESGEKIYGAYGGHRIVMDQATKDFLTSPDTMPATINNYEVLGYLGAGYKGVTFQVKKKGKVSTKYALKLTIMEEFEGSSYLIEPDAMAELAEKDRDHFPQIHDIEEWKCEEIDNEFVAFVEDYIKGVTLENLFKDRTHVLDAIFLDKFIREMLSALSTLEQCDLMHDDLHDGNIILADTMNGLKPYLIDFGSTKKRDYTKKLRDDLRNLGTHIAKITNIINLKEEPQTPYDESILIAAEALLAVMLDDDPLRRSEWSHKLKDIYENGFPKGKVKQTLVQPFDFGNAEEVIDNSLLYELATQTFPWRDKIESSANLLVVGPRGCGKTTVFRSMSYNCLADAGKIEEAQSLNYIGLYISCNKDFRQRFSALDAKTLEGNDNEFRHYFNLLVLREFSVILCNTLEHGKNISRHDLEGYITFLQDHVHLNVNYFKSIIDTLRSIESKIVKSIQACRMKIWNNEKIDNMTEQDCIAELAIFVRSNISAFRGKTLYLFVDDYTERKVPREVQSALNHILFVPNGEYKSKISSEVFGVPPDDTFGSFLDQDRDYKEWNLGTLYYLDLPRREQKKFLQEIVNNRLRMCKYMGTIDQIIGESRYPSTSLSKSIKEEYDAKQTARLKKIGTLPDEILEEEVEMEISHSGLKTYYHGWDTICELCTGDVSNILELLHRIYEQCDVKKDQINTISSKNQDAVIQSYSNQYLAKIKGIPKYGEDLFNIVNAFGTMSARLLAEYPYMERGEDRNDPYQLIRIEMDEAYTDTAQDLLKIDAFSESEIKGREKSALLWMLLQRYCIFIDAQESRSRRNTLASKVIMRRIFSPTFKTTLVNSESYTIGREKWNLFCADPQRTANRYVGDVVEAAKRKRGLEGRQRRLADWD